MTDLLIFGMFIVTLTSLTIALLSVSFILKHFKIVIEYLIQEEIDPYE